jgi:hypothetical protein
MSLQRLVSLEFQFLLRRQLLEYYEEITRFYTSCYGPMSAFAGNKLVSKEFSVRYRGCGLQQAGFQRNSVFIAAGTLPQKYAFRNMLHSYKLIVKVS